MRAAYQCGQLHVEIDGAAMTVVVCHCLACQRRSGSPFGMLAHYRMDQVSIAGQAARYERTTEEGGTFETFFCPRCGSSVYARDGKDPALILIAVGAIADPAFAAPVRSVWEETMHHWVALPENVQRYRKGRS